MRTSIGVSRLFPVAVLVGHAAMLVAVTFVIACCTIIILSTVNKRPPRLDWGSFHLSFDRAEPDKKADPDA